MLPQFKQLTESDPKLESIMTTFTMIENTIRSTVAATDHKSRFRNNSIVLFHINMARCMTNSPSHDVYASDV